jgi:hypothetical protein
MATATEHERKARHDEQFALQFDLNTTPYRDWVVTALFYAALHYVDAYLAKRWNQHPPKHRTRDSTIGKEVELRKIYNEYALLKNDSINARYLSYSFGADEVRKTVLPRYGRIKDHLSVLL